VSGAEESTRLDFAGQSRVQERVTAQEAIFRQLENKYPGITKVNRDEDGNIVLRG